MINRSQIITQKIVAKSTGNTLKFAQSSAADARQEAAAKAMYKKKALEFIQDGRLDRIGVASVYFNSLDPTEKMQVINYWKEKMTTGSSKEQAASSFVGGPVDQSWYEANGIIPLSQKGAFESRIKYLDQLASDIKLDMQAASGGQGAGAAASVAGAAAGAGSPKAQGPQQDMRSPYDPNVPLGAGPEGQKPTPTPTPTPTPASTPGSSPDTGADAAASKSKPDTGGTAAAGGDSKNVSTAPATAQNTPIPSTPAPASPAASKIYFFPSNKPVGVEGFHGPYVSPEGKKRYFKVRYDKDVKRFMFTGEHEDR